MTHQQHSKEHDDVEFEQLIRTSQHQVYSVALRLLRDPQEAEDMTQEAFIRLYEQFPSVMKEGHAVGWLKTVVTNLCFNHLSRYRKRTALETDQRGTSEEDGPTSIEFAGRETTDAPLIEEDRHRAVERAMQHLPDHQRIPLVLFHFEEKSYEDIAQELGASVSKIKTDIFRARSRLREELKDIL